MGARTELETALKAGLTGWNVRSTPLGLDAVPKPTALIWSAKMARVDLNGFEVVKETLEMWVLTTEDNPLTAEDDLESRLMDVLGVIEPLGFVTWTEANREVLADTWQGWHLTLECVSKINND